MDAESRIRIFMMPRRFPCGPQSSCCGPVGQTVEEIQALKTAIETQLGYGVEIIDATQGSQMRDYRSILDLVRTFGQTALPIITIGDEVASIGPTSPKEVVSVIKLKTAKK